MAILFMDGFDHYSTSGIKFSTVGTGAYDLIDASSTTVRRPQLLTMPVLGGLGLNIPGSGFNDGITKNLPSVYSTGSFGVGFHLYIPDGQSKNSANYNLMSFYNSSTLRYCVALTQAGNIEIRSAKTTGGTVYAASTDTLDDATLYHIEIKYVFSATVGGISIQVNGQPFVSALTLNTSAASVSSITWGYSGSNVWTGTSAGFIMDNFYIWDSTGTINNDFIGERNVYTVMPNADTATADWTLSSGTSGYDLINDVPPAGATNYLSSDTIGQESRFDLASLTNTGVTIQAIQVVAQAQKADSGAASLSIGVIESGGLTDYSADQVLTQSQYLYFTHVSETNPATSTFWTPSDIAGVKVGIKRA